MSFDKKKYNKQYRLNHKEELAKRQKEYYSIPKNREKKKERNKKYEENNKEKLRQHRKIYRDINKERFSKRDKEYYQKHKEKIKLKSKKYKEKNKEKYREYSRKLTEQNRKRIKKECIICRSPFVVIGKANWKTCSKKCFLIKQKQYLKDYYIKNRERIKEHNLKPEIMKRTQERMKGYYKRRKELNKRPHIRIRNNKYFKNRRLNDIEFNILSKLRCNLYKALRKYNENGKIMTSIKYGINYELIIENLKPFPKNMENYHIDHIIPLCFFNLNNPKEIGWAFAPENHQWLTQKENLEKGGRIIYAKEKESNY